MLELKKQLIKPFKNLTMKRLILFTCLVTFFSCNKLTNKLEGKYLLVGKGLYQALDFKDDKTVIVIDNLGFAVSYSCTYKIFENQLYIKTDENDLIFDIQPDLLTPSNDGNGFLKDLIGTFAKQQSKTYFDAWDKYEKDTKTSTALVETKLNNERLEKIEQQRAIEIDDSLLNMEFESTESAKQIEKENTENENK